MTLMIAILMASAGQIQDVPRQSLDHTRWPMVCRVTGLSSPRSGVLVWSDTVHAKVITVTTAGDKLDQPVTCDFSALATAFRGYVACYDTSTSVACIVIKSSDVMLPQIKHETPAEGDRVVVSGWSDHRFRSVATVVNSSPRESVHWLRNTLRPGEEGGAVFNWSGELLGVVLKGKDGWTLFASGVRQLADYPVPLIVGNYAWPTEGSVRQQPEPTYPTDSDVSMPTYMGDSEVVAGSTRIVSLPKESLAAVKTRHAARELLVVFPWYVNPWVLLGIALAVAAMCTLIWVVVKLARAMSYLSTSQQRLHSSFSSVAFTGRPQRGSSVNVAEAVSVTPRGRNGTVAPGS